MEFNLHQPVLLKEVISFLNLKPGYAVLDATVGGGGHALEILKKISPGGTLIGVDADESALRIAEETLKDFKSSARLVNDNFRSLDAILAKEGIKSLNAALLDLGVSSYQIEEGSRGFSIKKDGRLDMRMDSRIKITAYDIVNKYKEKDISEIIKKFGEERFHNRIARRIAQERLGHPIETTSELASLIRRTVGFGYRKAKIDPATRTFQALRIAVNDELTAIEEGLKQAVSWLGLGARIAVISFHSLEDRIVKNLFKGYSGLGILNILTKKPITPSNEETTRNPRSRSAKLRIAERI